MNEIANNLKHVPSRVSLRCLLSLVSSPVRIVFAGSLDSGLDFENGEAALSSIEDACYVNSLAPAGDRLLIEVEPYDCSLEPVSFF